MGPAVRLTNTDQFYDEASVVQNFTLGSRMVCDERTFHYARAGAALLAISTTYRLHITADLTLAANDRLTIGNAIIGATSLAVDITAAGGAWGALIFQAGTVAADEFAGGWAEIFPVAGGMMWRRIKSNTATLAGVPATTIVTFDRPLNLAVPAPSLNVTLHHSIYRNVQHPATAGLAGFQTAVCVPPIPVAANSFFWGQTWGPCFVSPVGPVWPGAAANFRDVYLWQDGCVESGLLAGIGVQPSPMRVGYALPGGNYGTGMIMLQLAP